MRILVFLLTWALALSAGKSEVFATQASLSCSPATGTFNVGETINVDYVLNTRSFSAYGVDINATYENTVLEAIGTQSTPETSSTKWTTPSVNAIDASLGKIHLDYGNSQAAFTGTATIGRISFKAKASGQAQFQYMFFQQYDDTTPGVAKVWGKKDGVNLSNILTDVTSCVYVVNQVAPTPTTGVGPTSPAGPTSPPPQPTVSELPRAGGEKLTLTLLPVAFLLLIAGVVIPAKSHLLS